MARRYPGEILFEAYLAEHGYPDPDYEPDLGVPTRPDYLVTRGGAEAICEVEEFDSGAGAPPSRVVWVPIARGRSTPGEAAGGLGSSARDRAGESGRSVCPARPS
jgi:hypothetical protein